MAGCHMFYFFYDIVLFLAALIYLPFYWLRGRVHRKILTRLGFFKSDDFLPVMGKDVIWIHAVSVGEARAAESLIRLIREQWPKKRIVVSTVTPTGYEIISRIVKKDELAFYAPLDISLVVARFLRHITPGVLIIMETEIWPNLIRLAKRRGTRVVVVNGRISDRSFRRYKRIGLLLKPVFSRVDSFCMQTQDAALKVIDLGAQRECVKVTGNIKFDISSDLKEPPFLPFLKSALVGCLFFIAGSTHENEEEMIIGVYQSLRKDFPNLRILIAPRHLERIDRIKRMIRLNGLETIQLSGFKGAAPVSSSNVMLLDTIGDLNASYSLCDIAFVGGSLVKKGGHNLIEPALFGKPIIFGKYMSNFKEIRNIFLKENAALEVDTPQALEYGLRQLLASPSQRQALGSRAKELIDKNRGAAQRTISVIQELLK